MALNVTIETKLRLIRVAKKLKEGKNSIVDFSTTVNKGVFRIWFKTQNFQDTKRYVLELSDKIFHLVHYYSDTEIITKRSINKDGLNWFHGIHNELEHFLDYSNIDELEENLESRILSFIDTIEELPF